MTNKRSSLVSTSATTSSTRGSGATTPMPLIASSSSSSSSSTGVLLPPPPPPPPSSAATSSSTSTATTAPRTALPILYKVDWNNDLEFKFLRAFFGEGGHCFRPIGLNKHFNMLVAYHRFRRSMGRNVDIECLWTKLDMFYDIDYLDEMEEDINRKQHGGGMIGGGHYNLPPCLFPPGGGSSIPEFELPDDVFGSEKSNRMNAGNNKSGSGGGGPKVKKRRVI